MDATTISAAKDIGLWALILLTVVNQLVIPLTNKILPGAVKHARDLEERRVKADESIARAITIGNERMSGFEKLLTEYGTGHNEINKTLTELVRGVSILIDRREREPERHKDEGKRLF